VALFLALHAMGVGPGDEVIVPSLSFIATANAVAHAGATPVFADVEPDTYNLDVRATEAAITPRTRAIMVVHQLGQPADLAAFARLSARRGVALLEDAACAIGAAIGERPIGGFGHLCCFSFHPRKILVTGEGGMITTDDADLAARLRRLRHQGMSVSDLERHRADRVIVEEYPEIGFNFRLSDLLAAVGIGQLGKLDGSLAKRREVAARYDAALPALGVRTRLVPPGVRPNWQSYIAALPGATEAQRNALLDALGSRGVASRRGLMAAHREAPYRRGGFRHAPLPHTEAAADRSFLLPIHDHLGDGDVAYVLEQLAAALREIGAGPRTRGAAARETAS
jgi:perosamine synthetase